MRNIYPHPGAPPMNSASCRCRCWIITNQLGRRNLIPEQTKYYLGKKYNLEKRQDLGHGNQKSGGQNDLPKRKTADRLATQHKVSEKTIKRDGKYAEAVGREWLKTQSSSLAGLRT